MEQGRSRRNQHLAESITMRRTLNVVLGLLLLAGANSLGAQAPTGPQAGPQQAPPGGEVRGAILDSASNTPLARASIAVRTKANAALVGGAVTNDAGTFRIQGLRPGTYYLRVTALGYGPVSTAEFTVSPASPMATVNPVKLTRVAVALSDVEVKGERDALTVEPDKNTYRAKDVAATANNASQVLENVPSVSVDGDGKVSLRGNENVVVQINGRPAPMSGTQLGNYLKQLPSAVIERVEVIPTPSARQDPEGMAGIINLVLKQNVDLGMSGGVTLSSATASGRYNGNGNLGYQSGPWTMFSSYGYNADDRDITGINDRIRLFSTGLPSSYTEQDILGQQKNYGHNFTTTVDYKVNTRDVLTNALTLNLRGFTDISVATYSELNSSRTLLDYYDRTRNTDVNSWMVDYTMALKRTLEPRKHEVSGEIRYNRNHDNDDTDQWRLSIGAPGILAPSILPSPVDRELASTDATTQTLNAQLDYMKMVKAKTKLETGYKGTGRLLDRDYDVRKDVLGNDQWLPSDLSNALDFTEQVHAAYGVVSQGAGKWDLQGGLRAEYARRDFTLKNSNESFPYDYFSLYPSAIANYKFSDVLTSKIAYSRRVRRPGTQELNPFPQFFDPQNVFFGNPKLNPEYTDAFEFGLVRTGKYGMLQLSPFFRHTTDIIRVNINTADTFEGRDVTSISFQNLDKSDSWGTDLNGQLRLGPLGNILAGFNVFKMVTDGGSASVLSSDAVLWRAQMNATFNVGKNRNTTLQGSYFYRSPQTIERGKFSAQQMANFSVRQKIMEGKATIALRVQDPFNTMGMRIRTGDDNITQITSRKFGVRAAFLTFQYNWGQVPKISQPKQQQDQPSSTGFPGG
jgi:outer membrane receptor protein involved in Fe transport